MKKFLYFSLSWIVMLASCEPDCGAYGQTFNKLPSVSGTSSGGGTSVGGYTVSLGQNYAPPALYFGQEGAGFLTSNLDWANSTSIGPTIPYVVPGFTSDGINYGGGAAFLYDFIGDGSAAIVNDDEVGGGAILDLFYNDTNTLNNSGTNAYPDVSFVYNDGVATVVFYAGLPSSCTGQEPGTFIQISGVVNICPPN